ncbi:MAG: hypothetical protein HC881_16790 [Leptolyngbyaceae cyanobacterium SL_7_1]|nr:hypothetical protein [Leptolyngbyaceae cyanobacterium SL_7_1]
MKQWLQQVDRWRQALALTFLAEQQWDDRTLNSHIQTIVLQEIANQLCQQHRLPLANFLSVQAIDATAPCFDQAPIEFLGQSYERLLKTPIRLCQKRGALTATIGKIKAQQGVHYTPTAIVQRMLQNTLGKVLHEHATEFLPSLRLLDPACGGGIF